MSGKRLINKNKGYWYKRLIFCKVVVINCILLFSVFQAYGQSVIKGIITDKDNQKLSFVNVTLQESDSISSVLAYTFSNADGEYQLETEHKGYYFLKIASLGYQSVKMPIELISSKDTFDIDIELKEKPLELNEVIVETRIPIRIKEDTITYNAQSFIKGNEVVLEDLLKKLPGVHVNESGRIMVGNREIERLTVDGDDLFEKGYTILSKNLPVHPIETIEIFKNFSRNPLLKGIEDSDKVAMNLTLKDESRNIWFGNVLMGLGTRVSDEHSVKLNLANFGKTEKYYFVASTNNVGDDAMGDINQLIQPFRYGEPATIGDNQQIGLPQNFYGLVPGLKENRFNFNAQKLLSLNSIFNLSQKAKLKSILFLTGDSQDFLRNTTQIFSGEETDFTNNETMVLQKRQLIGFAKIDLDYNISEVQNLKLESKFNNKDHDDRNSLLFNSLAINENLDTENLLFDQKLVYSNRFAKKKVLLLTGRYINEKANQFYQIDQFLYPGLFPEYSTTEEVEQKSAINYQFSGFDSHLFNRMDNGNLMEVQLGVESRVDNLGLELNLNEQNGMQTNPEGFQNDLKYVTNDFYLKSKYLVGFEKVQIIGMLDFHHIMNSLETDTGKDVENPFFINPKLKMRWSIDADMKIASSVSYTTTNSKVLNVTNNFYLNSYRSFYKGLGDFNQLGAWRYELNYELGEFGDPFFLTTDISYEKQQNYFSTSTQIEPNYSLSESIIIDDRNLFTATSNIDYYFKSIKNNLKFGFTYSISDFENIVNNSELRKIRNENLRYGINLRSGFRGLFNYHFGTEWTRNLVSNPNGSNGYTNNLSFLDLTFIFGNRWNMDIKNEYYKFGNLDTNRNFFLMDIISKYVLKKNKWSIFLDARNLLNTRQFRNFNVTDISTSKTSYKLLPRILLLKIEYQF